MRIKTLIVARTFPNYEIIRTIEFNEKGLNLIVDNTSYVESDSGNNVGKTTAIKIIDLCLGAKSVKSLYYDEDTKSENIEVRDFLKLYKVQAELILIDGVKQISLKRDLFLNGKRYYNNMMLKADDFNTQLKKIIFNNSEDKPSFRELIPKFVRLANSSEDKMIKFLPSMTTNVVYDAVYSYLFSIHSSTLINEKRILVESIKDCQKTMDMLIKQNNISSIELIDQKMAIIKTEKEDLIKKREQLSYKEFLTGNMKETLDVNLMIDSLSNIISILEFEIRNLKYNIDQINNQKENIDYSTLKKIYNEANIYLPNLEKTFEEMVQFHNNMIENRVIYFQKQMDEKIEELIEKKKNMDEYLKQRDEKIKVKIDQKMIIELAELDRQIEKYNIQIGELLKEKDLHTSLNYKKEELNQKLQEIIDKMKNDNSESEVKLFNQYFSNYSKLLYNEQYLLAYNSNWELEKKFPISVAALEGNVGTGKKKAVIVAFDLAYMQYSIHQKYHVPYFVIHDKMENTHINQLKTIFDICSTVDGQYIIPILRERIEKIDKDVIQRSLILELSSDDKFFKI